MCLRPQSQWAKSGGRQHGHLLVLSCWAPEGGWGWQGKDPGQHSAPQCAHPPTTPHHTEPGPRSRLPGQHLGQAARGSQSRGRAGDDVLTGPWDSFPEHTLSTTWAALFTASPKGVLSSAPRSFKARTLLSAAGRRAGRRARGNRWDSKTPLAAPRALWGSKQGGVRLAGSFMLALNSN